jgi:uncharacterized membrane protein (UPF0127 family)
MEVVLIENLNKSNQNLLHATVCTSFFSRLRGLMFTRRLDSRGSILMDEKQDSRLGTSIHMFFMSFDIAVIWINNQYRVVDKSIARRWSPFYMASSPARYILETHPDRIDDFSIGDEVRFLKQLPLS